MLTANNGIPPTVSQLLTIDVSQQADLSITKTDGVTTATPGGSVAYTITASNAGPSDATGASMSDPLPAGVTAATWVFAGATGGGSVTGPTSGSGALATAADGTVHYYRRIADWTGFWAKLDDGASHGRIGTVRH